MQGGYKKNMRLIVVTNNEHKFCEFKNIFSHMNMDFVNNGSDFLYSLADFGIHIDVEENGTSYEENANIKSKAAYVELLKENIIKKGDYIISDDSGLSIDYFDGGPGIYSARFMGNISQDEKNKKILIDMKNVQGSKRNAHFTTVLSVIEIKSDEDMKIMPKCKIFKGRVDGYIANNLTGTQGFGYDPIFAIGDVMDIKNNNVKTYASIGQNEKNKISHRAKAINSLVLYLAKNHNI